MSKEVFILGAGFSKAIYWYMPLLQDLTKKITASLNNEVNLRARLLEPFESGVDEKLINHFSNLPESIKNNIESLLCYLGQNYPWKDDVQKHFDLALYEYLTKQIANYFKGLIVTTGSQETVNPIELIRYIHSRSLAAISFNYDAVFESLYMEYCKKKYIYYSKKTKRPLENQYILRIYDEYSEIDEKIKENIQKDGYHIDSSYKVNDSKRFEIHTVNCSKLLHNPDFELTRHDIKIIESLKYKRLNLNNLYKMPIKHVNERLNKVGYEHTWEYEIAHLLKLHGSSNWYYNEQEMFYEDFFKSSGYNLNPTIFVDEKPLARQDFLSYRNSSRHGLKPLIIPPILDKTNFYTNILLRDLWSRAAEYLKEADLINIIGYSIPETDLAVRYFLNINIKKDAKINIINLCPQKDDEYLASYRNYFRQALSDFKNVNTDYIHYDEQEVLGKFIKQEIISKSNVEFIKSCQ